jgi:hypothetical protein
MIRGTGASLASENLSIVRIYLCLYNDHYECIVQSE